MTTDPIFLSACACVDALASAALSPAELLDALEQRITAVDPAVNALPTRCFDRARLREVSGMKGRTEAEPGALHGLPVVIKDLSDVAGVRSTHGSTVFADHVPDTSAHIVERIEARGGLVCAKSNTPEFGAGANTFNEVFGATRNPWNTALSAAGSSGGSAVALRTGMAWLAHGSDMGGSLRNPASFCGVVGLRPSPGRVPCGPAADPFDPLSTDGPMARSVADVALFLDSLTGYDPREPFSLPAPPSSFRAAAEAPRLPTRIAFSIDLGITPVDPAIVAICTKAVRQLEAAGVTVEEAHPDLSDAHEVFQTLRAHAFATSLGDLLEEHRDALKPEVVWNIEKGQALTSGEIGAAARARSRMIARIDRFLDTFDALLTPATIVPPFPVEDRYVTHCAGVEFETYIDWLAIAYAITLTALPALSLPAGFTDDGLPVGLQVVGRRRAEADLLAHAAAFEEIFALDPTPIDPRSPRGIAER
ncbi:MAG: amidase family protein [Pseudomonadota bacterium]